jgi:hypothetical protein
VANATKRGFDPDAASYCAAVKALLAIAVLLVLALPAAPLEAAPERTAVLRLVSANPTVLLGSRFIPGERVRVTARAKGRSRSRTLNAAPGGGFLVLFSDLVLERCDGFTATARGARGSSATLKLPQPACPPRGKSGKSH